MKNLRQIFESDKYAPDNEWMEEHFQEYNKEYFKGKLFTPHLEAKQFTQKGQDTWAGMFTTLVNFTFDKKTHQMYANGKALTSVEHLKPAIYLNSKFLFTDDELENTMVHEMIHFWNCIGGKWEWEKKGHGKGFLNKAAEIKGQTNGRLRITRYYNDPQNNAWVDDDGSPGLELPGQYKRRTGKDGINPKKLKQIQDEYYENTYLIYIEVHREWDFENKHNVHDYRLFMFADKTDYKKIANDEIEKIKDWGNISEMKNDTYSVVDAKAYSGTETNLVKDMVEKYGLFPKFKDPRFTQVDSYAILSDLIDKYKNKAEKIKIN